MRIGIGRLEYVGLQIVVPAAFTMVLVYFLSREGLVEYYGIINAMYLLYSIFPMTLRLKNLGRPVWHVLGIFIPFYNIYLGLILLFKKGSQGVRK